MTSYFASATAAARGISNILNTVTSAGRAINTISSFARTNDHSQRQISNVRAAIRRLQLPNIRRGASLPDKPGARIYKRFPSTKMPRYMRRGRRRFTRRRFKRSGRKRGGFKRNTKVAKTSVPAGRGGNADYGTNHKIRPTLIDVNGFRHADDAIAAGKQDRCYTHRLRLDIFNSDVKSLATIFSQYRIVGIDYQFVRRDWGTNETLAFFAQRPVSLVTLIDKGGIKTDNLNDIYITAHTAPKTDATK